MNKVLISLLMSSAAPFLVSAQNNFDIIPKPSSVSLKNGEYIFLKPLKSVFHQSLLMLSPFYLIILLLRKRKI